MVERLRAAVAAVLARAVAFYRAYPARSISYIVAAVLAVAGVLGITGIDADSLGDVLEVVLPILVGGEVVHRRVSPVATPATVDVPVRVTVATPERKVGSVSAGPGDIGKPRAAECRYGHPIDGTNGDRCPHGHAA